MSEKMSAEELAEVAKILDADINTSAKILFGRLLANIATLQREADANKDGWAEAFRLAHHHQSQANKYREEAAAAQREADGMREALLAIDAGRIDLQFDETTGRPLWHVAFVQLQSLARAALNGPPQAVSQTGSDGERK